MQRDTLLKQFVKLLLEHHESELIKTLLSRASISPMVTSNHLHPFIQFAILSLVSIHEKTKRENKCLKIGRNCQLPSFPYNQLSLIL